MTDAVVSHKQDAPREMRKTKDTTFDRIYKFYFNRKTNIALTDEEERVRLRWDYAWKLLANMYTKRQVVDAVCAQFQDQNIQKSIAYDDVNKAMMLFGDPRHANKEAKRQLVEEWLIKGIKKAWDDKDLDAYERLIGRYNKVNGLEVEKENEIPDFIKNLRPTEIIIVSDMGSLDQKIDQLQQQIQKDNIVDIAHTEIKSE